MEGKMTSKERVLKALRLERPDRVPVDLWINPLEDYWVTRDPSYAEVVRWVREKGDGSLTILGKWGLTRRSRRYNLPPGGDGHVRGPCNHIPGASRAEGDGL